LIERSLPTGYKHSPGDCNERLFTTMHSKLRLERCTTAYTFGLITPASTCAQHEQNTVMQSHWTSNVSMPAARTCATWQCQQAVWWLHPHSSSAICHRAAHMHAAAQLKCSPCMESQPPSREPNPNTAHELRQSGDCRERSGLMCNHAIKPVKRLMMQPMQLGATS